MPPIPPLTMYLRGGPDPAWSVQNPDMTDKFLCVSGFVPNREKMSSKRTRKRDKYTRRSATNSKRKRPAKKTKKKLKRGRLFL